MSCSHDIVLSLYKVVGSCLDRGKTFIYCNTNYSFKRIHGQTIVCHPGASDDDRSVSMPLGYKIKTIAYKDVCLISKGVVE